MKIFFDSHVHTNFSSDSNTDPNELINYAIAKNMLGLGITDHLDIATPAFPKQFDLVKKSLEFFNNAKAIYKDKLIISAGVELGQMCHNEEQLKKSFGYKYDFVLASVHNVKNTEDFYFINYKTTDCYKLMQSYFEEILELASSFDFDILAHLSYPLRYMQEVDISISKFADIIDKILKKLIERNIAFELNTKSVSQKLPDLEFLKRYYELGGELLTIGSDAHLVPHLALNFSECINNIKEIGFSKYHYYLDRKPIEILL